LKGREGKRSQSKKLRKKKNKKKKQNLCGPGGRGRGKRRDKKKKEGGKRQGILLLTFLCRQIRGGKKGTFCDLFYLHF